MTRYQIKLHGLTQEQEAALAEAYRLNPSMKPTYRSRKTAERMVRLYAAQGRKAEIVEIER